MNSYSCTLPRTPSFDKGQGPSLVHSRSNAKTQKGGAMLRRSPSKETGKVAAGSRSGRDSGVCSPEEFDDISVKNSRQKPKAPASLPLCNPLSAPAAGAQISARSVTVVSGGEGHINWSEALAGDSKYDDLCLLLWQCRTK